MDQTRDLSGRDYHRLTRLCPPPEFVKEAGDKRCGGPGLPPEAYGDPRRRLFPCDSAAATWTSLAFLLDKRAQFRADDATLIAERIMRAGAVHGIGNSLRELARDHAKAAAVPEAALEDDDYALVWEEDGARHRRYPLRNPAEVKAAAAYLLRYRDQLPFAARQRLADRVLQKQAALGVILGDLDEFVTKQAGHGAGTAAEAAALVRGRVYASRKGPGDWDDLQAEMLKFADAIAAKPSWLREPGVRVKVAETVDQFERTYGLVGSYGPDFPRVEDALFGLTGPKMAAAVREHCATVTGNIYRLADLERVKLAELRDYFGVDFAGRVTRDGLHVDSEKAAALIATLPQGDAAQLDRLLEGLGVRPVAKEASADAVRFSRQYLQDLAGQRERALAAH